MSGRGVGSQGDGDERPLASVGSGFDLSGGEEENFSRGGIGGTKENFSSGRQRRPKI